MVNFEVLREIMQKKEYSSLLLSQNLNMSHSEFLSKACGSMEFTVSEIYGIATALELTPDELSDIFF